MNFSLSLHEIHRVLRPDPPPPPHPLTVNQTGIGTRTPGLASPGRHTVYSPEQFLAIFSVGLSPVVVITQLGIQSTLCLIDTGEISRMTQLALRKSIPGTIINTRLFSFFSADGLLCPPEASNFVGNLNSDSRLRTGMTWINTAHSLTLVWRPII